MASYTYMITTSLRVQDSTRIQTEVKEENGCMYALLIGAQDRLQAFYISRPGRTSHKSGKNRCSTTELRNPFEASAGIEPATTGF